MYSSCNYQQYFEAVNFRVDTPNKHLKIKRKLFKKPEILKTPLNYNFCRLCIEALVYRGGQGITILNLSLERRDYLRI